MNEDTILLDYLQDRDAELIPSGNGVEMLWRVTDGEGFWHESSDLRVAIRRAMNLDRINREEEE